MITMTRNIIFFYSHIFSRLFSYFRLHLVVLYYYLNLLIIQSKLHLLLVQYCSSSDTYQVIVCQKKKKKRKKVNMRKSIAIQILIKSNLNSAPIIFYFLH